MKRACLCLCLLACLAFGTNAFACGDKLVQLGRGVRYQRARAVRPANIVMFLTDRSDRHAANRLRSDLTFVGHRVQIVDDERAFASMLAANDIDIVLTDVENLQLVTEHVNSARSKPAIIPLINSSAKEATTEIRSRFPYVMLLSAHSFEQLSVISRVMQ
jgi:hypothetical protein